MSKKYSFLETNNYAMIKNLELKIPPLMYLFTICVWIYLLKIYFPIYTFIDQPYNFIWIIIFICAWLFDLYLVYTFYKNNTSSNPITLKNTNCVLTTWIYSYTRNPMYLGMLFMILGVVIFLWNLLWLLWIIIFYYCITYLQILPEEDFLENKFGREYINYKKNVRRWL